MSAWHQLRIEVGRDDAEPWSDALLAAGALSVDAEDADADSPDEQPIYGEPGASSAQATEVHGWRRTRLAALLPIDADPRALVDAAASAMGVSPPPIAAVDRVDDRDWVRLTQAQFTPIPIGDRLLITPSWHADRDDGRIAIVLDPGLAFGTGSHPTTRLCLQWLERSMPEGASVIDYGCGSGILAIAAARLGASRVVGIDIDAQALDATRTNAARNGVALDVRASTDPRPAPADVVVANILSSPLKLLAPVLVDLLEPGGTLVLSGVLARQVGEVTAAYHGRLPLAATDIVEGWACLVGVKPR